MDGTDLNGLAEINPGFNLTTGNLDLGTQLVERIRVHLTTDLSSRRHAEAWVKEGHVLCDRISMIESDVLDRIMDHVTVRTGHFEGNYGDAHGRRTDNGSALYNPFVGNYGLEAFTTSKSATSGRVDPGFRDEVISLMLNPFVTMVGLELFGTYERSQEPGPGETAERVVPDREHLAEGRVRRPGL